MALDNGNFISLGIANVPPASRLVANACCPDKDLLVLIIRYQNAEKLSLWKMTGVKKWEVEVVHDDITDERVAGLAWSPDGAAVIAGAFDDTELTRASQDSQSLWRTIRPACRCIRFKMALN